ncbi:HNH endonuclease [Neiella marina]|uniref:HNH endonuclease n=1 Tax=Neiella holothuriorum TaxID=2870530 RepID=A0ABS7EDB1_9GAMM|nr:HNH endonuclease [Neiella holothuriorum]MBW8190303.1 HNH endonuclease [Neiella holothuriorum]
MKLTVNFSSLKRAIDLMEPEHQGDFILKLQESSISKLDLELSTGKDVELSDIDVDSGLLSYKGRNVTLYIKANGSSAKFHIADCSTLQSMRASGRFERYVVTNDTSGEFLIGYGESERKAKLKVCQNCLRKLNYKGCNTGQPIWPIVQQFDMAEFFATYSSFFAHMPSRDAKDAEVGYTEDWAKISAHLRVEKDFTCEQCNVNLRSERFLCHVHHVNGVKSDNRHSNLEVLCADCHSKQPSHGHMALTHQDRILINDLRKAQGILEGLGQWQKLFDYADPGVQGALHACRKMKLKMPEVGYYIDDGFGDIAAKVELAWPNERVAVAVSLESAQGAENAGWKVVGVGEFIDGHQTRTQRLKA